MSVNPTNITDNESASDDKLFTQQRDDEFGVQRDYLMTNHGPISSRRFLESQLEQPSKTNTK